MSAAAVAPLVAQYGRTQTLAAVRRVLDAARQALLAPPVVGGAQAAAAPPLSGPLDAIFAARVRNDLETAAQARFRTVFNLTGTVLHTNLGRALLPEAAIEAVGAAPTRPTHLEFH